MSWQLFRKGCLVILTQASEFREPRSMVSSAGRGWGLRTGKEGLVRAGESCPFYHPPFLPRVQKGLFPLAPAVATLSSIETPPTTTTKLMGIEV